MTVAVHGVIHLGSDVHALFRFTILYYTSILSLSQTWEQVTQVLLFSSVF